MLRAVEQYVLVIRLFKDMPSVVSNLEALWETIDDEDDLAVAMRYYFLKVRFTYRFEIQFTNEQKNNILMNIPHGSFVAYDIDDYEEITDDMLDEGSDVEDPNF